LHHLRLQGQEPFFSARGPREDAGGEGKVQAAWARTYDRIGERKKRKRLKGRERDHMFGSEKKVRAGMMGRHLRRLMPGPNRRSRRVRKDKKRSRSQLRRCKQITFPEKKKRKQKKRKKKDHPRGSGRRKKTCQSREKKKKLFTVGGQGSCLGNETEHGCSKMQRPPFVW